MNLFLCLLGPSLISIKIFNNLNKKKLSNKISFYCSLLIFLCINNYKYIRIKNLKIVSYFDNISLV